MSVQNSNWSFQQDNPIFREPDPPVSTDSDSGHRPVESYEDTSAQAPSCPSLGPPCLDINQASNWPGFRTLLQQLPPQDSDERYCLALGEEELAQLQLFCAQRKQKSVGQGVARLLPPKLEGYICEKCKKLLNPGEYGVFAARAGERCCWHRPCFACQACGQALINLIYYYHDGHLYCGRHHAELLRPRCPACDQLIFSQRCTEAEGQRWHENHFCCQDCAGPLDGGRYALPGGSPCCPSCFARRYRSTSSSSVGAAEGQACLGKGGDSADLKGRERRLGLSIEGGNLPGQNPSPHPSPHCPTRSSNTSSSHRNPQTRASGPAALTARPWPASSKGLLNPPGGAAAPDSLPGGGGGRPLVDGGGGPWGRLAAAVARTAQPGAGREAARNPGPPLARGLGGSEMGISDGSGTGEEGPDPSVGWNRASSDDKIISQAALPSAVTSLALETPSGASKRQDRDGPQTPGNPEEDSPCPTCSSSSESEPEGFFFGRHLPDPWKSPENLQADDRDISRKHCAIC